MWWSAFQGKKEKNTIPGVFCDFSFYKSGSGFEMHAAIILYEVNGPFTLNINITNTANPYILDLDKILLTVSGPELIEQYL